MGELWAHRMHLALTLEVIVTPGAPLSLFQARLPEGYGQAQSGPSFPLAQLLPLGGPFPAACCT